MSKRFIDTNMFSDSWFSELSPNTKLFYIYLITKCDHAGIIDLNLRLAEFETGIKELANSYQTVSKELGNRLLTVRGNYHLLPKFLKFQYPKGLSPNVKAQLSVINRLKEFDLNLNSLERVSKQLANSYLTVQDKDKDIDLFKEYNKKGVVKGVEEIEEQKPDMDYRQKSAKAFIDCVKVYPKEVRQNQINYCRNSWNEAVERADGFESIVMAVNMFIDYIATTKQELKFVKNFQKWLDEDQFNIDWTQEKLKMANIPAQHIHQNFIDLWIIKTAPTKATIEAGKNLLAKKDQLKTEDLIRVFEKDKNLDLASLIAKVERLYNQPREIQQSSVNVVKNAEKKKITDEEIRIMREMMTDEQILKQCPELFDRIKEGEDKT